MVGLEGTRACIIQQTSIILLVFQLIKVSYNNMIQGLIKNEIHFLISIK